MVPLATVDCFSEFLPTRYWLGTLSDRTMTFRLTARDFLGPPTNRPTITWDVAGTDSAPVNVTQVKLSLSTDGGKTFAYVLADATPNDGSEAVTLPNQPGTARIKVEAVGSVFQRGWGGAPPPP